MNKEKFIELLKETLEIEDQEVKLEDKFRDYEEWGSLAYLSLLAMIDEEFEVVIQRKEFDNLETVYDLFNYLKNKQQK